MVWIKKDVFKEKDNSWDDAFCSCCNGYLYSHFKKYGQTVGFRPATANELSNCPHCNINIAKEINKWEK